MCCVIIFRWYVPAPYAARMLGKYLKASKTAEDKAINTRAHVLAGREYKELKKKRGYRN